MMDPKKMGKQMMDLYKTAFDNSYGAMMMLQGQMERMGAMYWGQTAARRDEMMDPKKMGKQMMDFYKTSFDNSYAP